MAKKKVDIALQDIRNRIQEYHGDTKSRSAVQTKDGLEEIQADIEGMLIAFEEEGI